MTNLCRFSTQKHQSVPATRDSSVSSYLGFVLHLLAHRRPFYMALLVGPESANFSAIMRVQRTNMFEKLFLYLCFIKLILITKDNENE